jgi:Tol biopolymer transport system component
MAWALAAVFLVGFSRASGRPLARIAYDRNGSIFTVAANGNARSRLTGAAGRHPFSGNFEPAWSPDGSRIAFVRERKLGHLGARLEIHLIGSNGSGKTTILPGTRRTEYVDPQWNPDGQHLSVIRWHEDSTSLTSAVVIVSPNGSDERAIAKLHVDASTRFAALFATSWSPDGTQLAVTRERIDRHGYFRNSLYSMSSDGADVHLLAADAADASYSPDGSQIAFTGTQDRHGHNCDEDNCSYDGEIYIADADGSNARRLTDTTADDETPDWSADGRRIVFQSSPLDRRSDFVGSPHLFSVAPSGNCISKLTGAGPDSSAPDWEPNPARASSTGGCQ